MAVAAPQTDATKHNYRFEYVRVADLKIDPTYHVPERFREKRALRYAAPFDEDRLGIVTVSNRDGTLWLIDGNHRRAAASLVGLEYLYAKVYIGLTLQQEANIFIGLSDQVPLSGMDLWVARRVDRDPVVLGVEEILDRHGAVIGRGGSASEAPNATRAVTTLERIYRSNVGLFDLTIGMLRRVWPNESRALDSIALRGVSSLVYAYTRTIPTLNVKRFEDRLAMGGPEELYRSFHIVRKLGSSRGKASGSTSDNKGGNASVLAWSTERRSALMVYNHKLRHKLPELTLKDLHALRDGVVVDIRGRETP